MRQDTRRERTGLYTKDVLKSIAHAYAQCTEPGR